MVKSESQTGAVGVEKSPECQRGCYGNKRPEARRREINIACSEAREYFARRVPKMVSGGRNSSGWWRNEVAFCSAAFAEVKALEIEIIRNRRSRLAR